MSDTNGNAGKPSASSNTIPLPDPVKIREEAREKARSINPPDLDSMTNEEIQQVFYEMQVKKLEAELENEQLRSWGENYKSKAELLATVTENMLDMVVLSDLEGNITLAGKAHEKLGYKDGFLIGKNVMEFVHREHHPYVLEEFNKLLSSGGPRTVEYLFRCNDGSYMWLETLGRIVTDESNNPQKIVLSSRDITGRKRMEEGLRESEERYRLLVETSNDIVWTFDLSSMRYTYCSKSVETILGYSQEEVNNFKLDDIHPPETKKKVVAAFDQVFKGESNSDQVLIEAEHRHKNGSLVWMEISAVMHRNNLGQPVSFTGVSRDISERKNVAKAIENERAFLSAVIDNVEEAIVICDAEGRIARFNEKARRLHGLPEQPVPPEQWAEYYDLYQEDGIIPLPTENMPLFRALQGERVRNVEIVVAPKHSKPYSLVCNGQALTDEKGKIYGAVVAMHDITERKRMEEALRESEQRFRQWFESSPISLWEEDFSAVKKRIDEIKDSNVGSLDSYFRQRPELVWEMAGMVRVLDVNKATLDLYRAESKEEFFAGITKVFFKESLEGFLQVMEVIAAGEKEFVTEKEHVMLDGQPLKVQLYWTVAKGHEEDYSRVLVSIVDITQRKQAEQQLRESEEKYRMLVENLNEVIYTLDEKGRITYVSPTVESVGGYTASELLGKQFIDFVHPDDKEGRFEQFSKILSGMEEPSEYRFLTKDNQVVWVRTTGRPLLKEGQVAGVQGVLVDITERKKAEQERDKLEAQLRHAQKIEAIGTLAGGIAHDFNNILSSVIGYTELSLDEVERGSVLHRNLSQVLTAGNRAKDLVKQILTLSRQEEQEFQLTPVVPLVKEALKMLRSTFPSSIEIRENILAEQAVVHGDPTQLHQVLVNLATNAKQALSDQGGVLEVSVEPGSFDENIEKKSPDMTPGNYVRIAVSDTGCGISEQYLDRIFEPYFTTSKTGTGTGLGLSVVHGIVKDHSGHIAVYSEPGKGTTFHVYLPSAEQEKSRDISTEQVGKELPTGTESILLVEDEKPIIDMQQQILETLGYHVTSRTSSVEALEAFRANPYKFDLLVTDMTMPNMTGDRLALKVKEIRPDIPVILCTGFSETINGQQRKELGIKDFLMKPVTKKDAAEAVRKALDRNSLINQG